VRQGSGVVSFDFIQNADGTFLPGGFVVTFNRDVSTCATVATLGQSSYLAGNAVKVVATTPFFSHGQVNGNAVGVYVLDSKENGVDGVAVSLALFC
jgi:hypothetical protein